jgi:hypothetical protein
MIGVRHPDGRQLSGSMKTGEHGGVTTICLHPIACLRRNQRRRHHVAPMAQARNLAVQRSRQASMQEVGILWLTRSLGDRLMSAVASMGARMTMRPSGPRCSGPQWKGSLSGLFVSGNRQEFGLEENDPRGVQSAKGGYEIRSGLSL